MVRTRRHAYIKVATGRYRYGMCCGRYVLPIRGSGVRMRLEGKEIVITGATDGIGKVTARELAKMGASVTIVARDAAKAQTIIKELRTAAGHDRVGFVRADLSSQKSIRGAAETIKARLKRLDVLINNAGAM